MATASVINTQPTPDEALQRLTALVEALDFDAAAALLAQEVTR